MLEGHCPWISVCLDYVEGYRVVTHHVPRECPGNGLSSLRPHPGLYTAHMGENDGLHSSLSSLFLDRAVLGFL